MEPEPHVTELLSAIEVLEDAVRSNGARNREILRRLRRLRTQISRRGVVAEVVQSAPPPLVVELLSENIETLHNASASFRQAEAEALYAEGMTMEAIAKLFGVTRQRVSAILKTSAQRSQRRVTPPPRG